MPKIHMGSDCADTLRYLLSQSEEAITQEYILGLLKTREFVKKHMELYIRVPGYRIYIHRPTGTLLIGGLNLDIPDLVVELNAEKVAQDQLDQELRDIAECIDNEDDVQEDAQIAAEPYTTPWEPDYFTFVFPNADMLSCFTTQFNLSELRADSMPPAAPKPRERVYRWYLQRFTDGGLSVNREEIRMEGKEQVQSTDLRLYPSLNIDEIMRAYMESKENLLFLYGVFGTGKTHLMRYLSADYADAWYHRTDRYRLERARNFNVAYTDDRSLLLRDDFWSLIRPYPVVILDDLDTELRRAPHLEDASSPLTNRLRRQSNGVIESKQKLIITTNCKVDDIDPALMRSGRCFDFIELEPMTAEYAWQCWREDGRDEEIGRRFFSNRDFVTQAEYVTATHWRPEAFERPYTRPARAYTIETKLAELRAQREGVMAER